MYRKLLNETRYILKLLLEAREDGLLKRFVPEIIKNSDWALSLNYVVSEEVRPFVPEHDDMDAPEEKALAWAEGIIRYVISCDPDPKKSYSTWIMTRYLKRDFLLEDMPRLVAALTQYNEGKKGGVIPRNHDIGTIKSVYDLYEMVSNVHQQNGEIIDLSYDKKMRSESTVLLDNSDYFVVVPKTQEAAQWFGRNTEWCTAWGGEHGRHPSRNCLWRSYSNAPLYIVQDKRTGELWQFSFKHHQYMDVHDRPINVNDFVKRHLPVASVIGPEAFISAGASLSFFGKELLSGIPVDQLILGVHSINDFKMIDDKLLIEAIKKDESYVILNRMLFLKLPVVQDHAKIIGYIVSHYPKKEPAYDRVLTSGISTPLYQYLPDDFKTDEYKIKLAERFAVTSRSIEQIIPLPWPDEVYILDIKQKIDNRHIYKAEQIPQKYRNNDTLLRLFSNNIHLIDESPEFLNTEIVNNLVGLSTHEVCYSICKNLPEKYLTKDLADNIEAMAKTNSDQRGWFRALSLFPYDLWPKNTKMRQRIAIESEIAIDDLPPDLNRDKIKSYILKLTDDALKRIPKEEITRDVISAYLLPRTASGNISDKSMEIYNDRIYHVPTELKEEYSDVMIALPDHDLLRVNPSFGLMTKRLADRLIQIGKLGPDNRWFDPTPKNLANYLIATKNHWGYSKIENLISAVKDVLTPEHVMKMLVANNSVIKFIDPKFLTTEVLQYWINNTDKHNKTVFDAFPKSTWNKEIVALAVKKHYLKSEDVPKDFIDDEVKVQMLRKASASSTVDWDQVSIQNYRDAIKNNLSLLYLDIPDKFLEDAESSLEMLKDNRYGIYNDRIKIKYINPDRRKNWTAEHYKLAVSQGVFTLNEVPKVPNDVMIDAIKRRPENILYIENPVSWLNENNFEPRKDINQYGFYFDKIWKKAVPKEKCSDGFYTIYDNYAFIFDKNENVILSAKKSSIVWGKTYLSENFASAKTLRDFLNTIDIPMSYEFNFLQQNMEIQQHHDGKYYLVNDLPRLKIGNTYYITKSGRNNSFYTHVRLFADDKGDPVGDIVLSDNKFITTNIPVNSLSFGMSKDIAEILEKRRITSGTNPNFKASNLYKIGVRGPGKGEWFSLLGEEITKVGNLTVWKSDKRICVTHDAYGVVAVGKKSKDGMFSSTENFNYPEGMEQDDKTALGQSLNKLFDAISGKL